jgi:hypothetical protein
MNLKQNPTKEQLRALIANQVDSAGHHMIWVSVDGDVFVDTVPQGLTPIGYAKSLDGKIQFRLETLVARNDYVGPKAAKDEVWIDRLFAGLLSNYERGVEGYVDTF